MKTRQLLKKCCLFLSVTCLLIVSSCNRENGYYSSSGNLYSEYYGWNGEEYTAYEENQFLEAQKAPLSTFSVDVDVASYGTMRRCLNGGELPQTSSVRTEELVNYFSYAYEQPTDGAPVKITTETGTCPWNEKHRLVRIAVKAREIPAEKLPASNFVFLVDVSGSMFGATRLGLVKSSLKLLVNNLREEDRVSIVVYAGSAGLVLPPTSGENKQRILEALNDLQAGGSTAGGEGIKLAYRVARQNFINGGNNRIILCTDGDFNVGISSTKDLEAMIENERKSGVFLTILGYGMGNYKDNRMQVLAEKGNGNHAYIDNLPEANKVLIGEFGSTLYAVAKDVKLQVEFNPEHVLAYRLIGYESRLMDHEDFDDDKKDAGDMGPGHAVTAFYEVVPVGSDSKIAQNFNSDYNQKNGDPSKLMMVNLRYKEVESNTSKKIELPVIDNKGNQVSGDFRFASAVAMFAHLLRDSKFKEEATYDKVISLAKTAVNENDENGYRKEFVRLVEVAKGLKK